MNTETHKVILKQLTELVLLVDRELTLAVHDRRDSDATLLKGEVETLRFLCSRHAETIRTLRDEELSKAATSERDEFISDVLKIQGWENCNRAGVYGLRFCTGLCMTVEDGFVLSSGHSNRMSYAAALEVAHGERLRMMRRLKAFREILATESYSDPFDCYCNPESEYEHSECRVTLDTDYLTAKTVRFEREFGLLKELRS